MRDDGKSSEWKAKLLAYLRVMASRTDEWVEWCSRSLAPIQEEDFEEAFPGHGGRPWSFP